MEIRAIHALENEAYFLQPVSRTFHGRDVFAPVAAHLSRGVPIQKFGPALKDFVRLDWPEPRVRRGGIEGEVVYIDRFGNAITNLEGRLLESPLLLSDLLTSHEPPAKDGPLTPAFSPSEGKRENPRQVSGKARLRGSPLFLSDLLTGHEPSERTAPSPQPSPLRKGRGRSFGRESSRFMESSVRAWCEVYAKRRWHCPLAGFYQAVPPKRPFALVGSSGFLEIAINGGSAAEALGVRIGTRVVLRAGECFRKP